MKFKSSLLLLLGQCFASVESTSFMEVETQSLDMGVPPEPYYGDFLGSLTDEQNIGLKGNVYVVNDSCIQLINFTINDHTLDLFFWADSSSQPTAKGLPLPTFEYGDSPLKTYNNSRVVLIFPSDRKVTDFKVFGVWSQAHAKNYGHVEIPDALTPPKPAFISGILKGIRYNIGSGPILVMDRRTVKVYGFRYDGKSAPDGYFFVGKGPEPTHSLGVKVPIRERDRDFITAIKEEYKGNKDLILDLPEDYDIYNIDWISVYCWRFKVDFGHVKVMNVSKRIPPYVPPQQKRETVSEVWPATVLPGRENRREFTFHLGPPGGKRGYEGLARAKPEEYVWYVNGYMTPELWLQRGVKYTFFVGGGQDPSTEHFYNPLYISNEPFGGYMRLSPDDREKVQVYLGMDSSSQLTAKANSSAAGRLCLWSSTEPDQSPDEFENFTEFRKTLQLECKDGKPAVLHWTPDENTPDTVFYQSFNGYNMGWKIMVREYIPDEIPDFKEEPYKFNLWREREIIAKIPKDTNSAVTLRGPSLIRWIAALSVSILCFFRT